MMGDETGRAHQAWVDYGLAFGELYYDGITNIKRISYA